MRRFIIGFAKQRFLKKRSKISFSNSILTSLSRCEKSAFDIYWLSFPFKLEVLNFSRAFLCSEGYGVYVQDITCLFLNTIDEQRGRNVNKYKNENNIKKPPYDCRRILEATGINSISGSLSVEVIIK